MLLDIDKQKVNKKKKQTMCRLNNTTNKSKQEGEENEKGRVLRVREKTRTQKESSIFPKPKQAPPF